MAESLRERKRRRTRQALVDAGARLFAERGYAGATIADIAAAAEVGHRTFFSYFASKEELLFPESEERIQASVAVIRSGAADEDPTEVLARAATQVVTGSGDLAGPMAALRVQLARTEPSVSRVGAQFLLRAQQEFTRALVQAYPDDLDPVDAAAMVGAFVGAASGTVAAMLETDGSALEQASSGQLGARLQRSVDATLQGWRPAR